MNKFYPFYILVMDAFVTSIKKKYRDRLINRERQWPRCKSKKLTRLELIEKRRQFILLISRYLIYKRDNKDVKRIPLAYDDPFNVESGNNSIKRILVSVSAGI